MADPSSKPDLGKVVVIGGCGFLGSHIVDALRSTCKAEIFVVSRSATKYPDHHPDVKYIDVEINKTNAAGVPDIESVFAENKIDVVFHTATPSALTGKEQEFEEVNIKGTNNVILAAQHTGVKAFVYTSSQAVTLPNFQEGASNADESWPLILGKDQADLYARSKAAAEKAVIEANHPGGLRTCALRPGGMVGIRDNLVTPTIGNLYFNGDPNTQIGDDTALSDYGSVLDTARTHVSAAVALLRAHSSPTPIPESERVDGEAFYITGEHVRFWTFARSFYKHFGNKADKKPTVLSKGFALILARVLMFFFGLVGKESPLKVNDVYYACATMTASNEKAKKRLGYEVREPIDVAVEKASKWYLENRRPKST
ncbi:NAD(P)-binding protein [Mollisia scopiformis]|uniref:NAD(P)-binding protein n=1 Tax=Mollisia scopiformis TaxID=149040 RepID=A0A194XHZ1_MOLSC|nr:NAD(P)-binding protein [Mollisia scopiformis]KUJ19778.1 NAD(P)-binding protein [Mollisia scopiformis]